jgi:hypothetical protein
MVDIFEVPENMTNVADLLPFASDISGGILGILLLIMLGTVSFMITSAYNSKQSITATAFIMVVSSAMLWILGLLSPHFYWVSGAILVVAILFSLIKGGGATA